MNPLEARPELVDVLEIEPQTVWVQTADPVAPYQMRPEVLADIVRLGAELNVPFAETWSCYKGGLRHCGTCGTCVERREAFTVAGVTDPTEYEAIGAAA